MTVSDHEGRDVRNHFSSGLCKYRDTGVRVRMRILATLPGVQPGAFLLITDKEGRSPRGPPPGGALLLCVEVMHCWEISLG